MADGFRGHSWSVSGWSLASQRTCWKLPTLSFWAPNATSPLVVWARAFANALAVCAGVGVIGGGCGGGKVMGKDWWPARWWYPAPPTGRDWSVQAGMDFRITLSTSVKNEIEPTFSDSFAMYSRNASVENLTLNPLDRACERARVGRSLNQAGGGGEGRPLIGRP